MADSNRNVQGIVIAELDKQMLNIIDCSNKIKAIFSKIDDQVSIMKTHYSCSAANMFFQKYEEINENYSIIVENLLSYNADLMTLKKSYASTYSDLTQKLQSSTAKLTAGIDEYKEKR